MQAFAGQELEHHLVEQPRLLDLAGVSRAGQHTQFATGDPLLEWRMRVVRPCAVSLQFRFNAFLQTLRNVGRLDKSLKTFA